MRDSMVGWFLDHYVYIDWEFNSVGIGYSVESIIIWKRGRARFIALVLKTNGC